METSGNYLTRNIKNTIRMAAIIAFGGLQDKVKMPKFMENCAGSSFYERLTHMIDEGKINEAENELIDEIDFHVKADLAMALAVYDYINDKEDGFLEEHHYTREEIEDGVKNVLVGFGYEGIF